MIVLMTGLLWGAGIFLLLRKSLIRIVVGLNLLGHAANLTIFVAGGLRTEPAFLPLSVDPSTVADPLPQALILTAIVIGFGLISFAVVVLALLWRRKHMDVIDEVRGAD